MSLPRSIDRSDLQGATINLATTTETVVLVGPNLQTPKDTSIVVLLATVAVTVGTAGTGITLRVRQGNSISGAQIGQAYAASGLVAGQTVALPILVSAPANFTDYQQWSITAQQVAATANGTVTAATLLAISF